jgi:hypothetical protein
MKTPREILLQRHKAAEAYLDNARRIALASLEPPGLGETLRDWLLSMRRHLAGLSAVWLAVLILNIASAPATPIVMAREPALPARMIVAALLENRRELLELTDALPPVAVPAAAPPRRSEIRIATEIV